MDSYKWLNKVNSQICEQRNNVLRKLGKSIAHMKFENYMKTRTLFCAYTNLKAKGVLPTPFYAYSFLGLTKNNTKLKPSTKVIISILSSATFWCIGIHQIDDNIYSNVENRPNLRLIIHKHVDQIYSNLVWVSIRLIFLKICFQ